MFINNIKLTQLLIKVYANYIICKLSKLQTCLYNYLYLY